MNRLDRMSAILIALQSRSVVRAADLAQRFDVSIRTIYRDIRTLEQAGVPICGEAGMGYSLVEGYRLPPLMFTPAEAMAFLTAEKMVEQMTDKGNSDHFRSGMDKVRAVMKGEGRGYMKGWEGLESSILVRRGQTSPERIPGLLQTILGSIASGVILEMDYTNVEGAVSCRQVEAAGVVFVHPNWYMMAWCHLRGEYRTFRLDRIDRMTVTEQPHTISGHPPPELLVGLG